MQGFRQKQTLGNDGKMSSVLGSPECYLKCTIQVFSQRSVSQIHRGTGTCEPGLMGLYMCVFAKINFYEIINVASTGTTVKIISVHMSLCHTKIVAHFV